MSELQPSNGEARRRLSVLQERRVGGISGCDLRSVRKAYLKPEACRPSTLERVAEAARELGYEPPAEPSR